MAKKKRALADMLLGYLWNLQQAQELNQLSDEEQAAAAQNLWGSVMDLREQLERLQLPAVPSREVVINKDGTILNGEDFVIGEDVRGSIEARVLLASFGSVDEARAAWQAIRDALPDVFGDIEAEFPETAAQEKSAAFVDLYAQPFPSREAAENACIELRARFGDTFCNPLDISIK